MLTNIPLLQNVRIAAPCQASWADMTPVDGDRVRHCGDCKLNVYNLSAMTQAEAEGLLRRHEGRLCVRYYQRQDGSVLTRNCPVGAHAARLLLIRQSLVAAVLLAAAVGAAPRGQSEQPLSGQVIPAATGKVAISVPVMRGPALPPPQPTMGVARPEPLMGDVSVQPTALQGEVAPKKIAK